MPAKLWMHKINKKMQPRSHHGLGYFFVFIIQVNCMQYLNEIAAREMRTLVYTNWKFLNQESYLKCFRYHYEVNKIFKQQVTFHSI